MRARVGMTGLMIALLLAVATVVSCGGGPLGTTPVKKLIEQPRDYEGKTVTVKGEVKEALSLIFAKYFVLDDGTGEIHVTTERPLPKVGQTIRVTGTLEEAFSLGDFSVTVLHERQPEKKTR